MKALIVKDDMTAIPVVAFRVGDLSHGLGQAILHRAGYGPTPETQDTYVALWQPSNGACHTDPHAWGNATMTCAHLHLIEAYDAEPHGGTIDVEPYRLALAEGRLPSFPRAAVG